VNSKYSFTEIKEDFYKNLLEDFSAIKVDEEKSDVILQYLII